MSSPNVRLVDAGDGRLVPWGNGLGTSREILSRYDSSEHGEPKLLWRMSTTEIQQSCVFSDYAGYSRCITLLSEDAFDLDFSNAAAAISVRRFVPAKFHGSWQTFCHLEAGPALVLNVMALDGHVHCSTELVTLQHEAASLCLEGATSLIFCAHGALRIELPGRPSALSLTEGQTLAIDGSTGSVARCCPMLAPSKAIAISVHYILQPA